MKKRIEMMAVLILLVLSLVVVGCPPPAVEDPPPGVDPLPPMALSFATGGIGGIFFVYGGAVSDLIMDSLPGFTATAEVTGASIANVRMMQAGDVELAITTDDVLIEAWEGTGRFVPDGRLGNLAALWHAYPSYFRIVVRADSPIRSFADLRGHRVSIGAPGSATEMMFTNIMTALGMTHADFSVSRLSFDGQVTAFRDGVIDAGTWVVGLAPASIIDLTTTHDMRFISFSPDEVRRITAMFPYYFPVTVPAGIYRGVPATPTLGIGNTVIGHRALPERVVYEIVKAIFDPANLARLRTIHPAFNETVLEKAARVPIPLHPGAERFYRERGVLR